jgi:hypothetical protein
MTLSSRLPAIAWPSAALMAVPFPAAAQQAKAWRIGYLSPQTPNSVTGAYAALVDGLRRIAISKARGPANRAAYEARRC